MKKLLSLVLLGSILVGLVGCGSTPSVTMSSSQPVLSSSSVPEEIVLEPAYLTGEEKDSDYPEGQRIVGVMMNNRKDSWPHSGMSEAKIVYEIVVEGGITRFMCVFEDYKTLPKVGSVRSARDQFFQLLLPTYGFYVHDGPNVADNPPVIQMLRTYEYDEFNIEPNKTSGAFYRDPARYKKGWDTDATEYIDGERLAEAIASRGLDDYRSYGSPIFNFVPYTDPARVLEGGTATDVIVTHSNAYRSSFIYNESTGQYEMAKYVSASNPQAAVIDENTNTQVAFDNVIVLFAPMTNYANSPLVKVDYTQGGIGYYFNGGKFEVIRWQKGGPNQALQLFVNDTTATPLQLNVGTSYIGIVDDDNLEKFASDVQSGSFDPNAVVSEPDYSGVVDAD